MAEIFRLIRQSFAYCSTTIYTFKTVAPLDSYRYVWQAIDLVLLASVRLRPTMSFLPPFYPWHHARDESYRALRINSSCNEKVWAWERRMGHGQGLGYVLGGCAFVSGNVSAFPRSCIAHFIELLERGYVVYTMYSSLQIAHNLEHTSIQEPLNHFLQEIMQEHSLTQVVHSESQACEAKPKNWTLSVCIVAVHMHHA